MKEKYAIGVYRELKTEQIETEKERILVGNIPIEISQLLYHFRNAHSSNKLWAIPTGKRKREIGLVVPARFLAQTNDLVVAEILDKEIEQNKIKSTLAIVIPVVPVTHFVFFLWGCFSIFRNKRHIKLYFFVISAAVCIIMRRLFEGGAYNEFPSYMRRLFE